MKMRTLFALLVAKSLLLPQGLTKQMLNKY